MNKGIIIPLSGGLRICAALLLAAVASFPLAVKAQTTVPNLTINSCDGQKFPQVTCVVTALDRFGLPATGLNASSFDVLEAGASTGGATVSQNVNSGVPTSLLFVVDLSASLRGTTAQTLKDAMDKTLDDMKDPAFATDLVALIALTTNKIDVGTNPNSPPMDPTREVPFSIDKVLPRNTLRPLTSSGSTPLYDGIRKALVLTAQQPLGKRAIIVLSDGFDSRSSGFTIDSDITMAQRDVTPIYTIKFGQSADNAKLQRMALDTGGEVIPPGTPDQVSAGIRKVQERLKTQYQITFKSKAAPGQTPDISIRWKTPSGILEQKAKVSKLPTPAPQPITVSAFTINGDQGDLNETPLKGSVTIAPVLGNGTPTQVDYSLDGKKSVQKQAPFEFTFNADDLKPDSQLAVSIYSSPGVSTTQTFALKQAPAVTASAQVSTTVTAVPGATKAAGAPASITSNPTLMIAIVIAVVGLLVLLILIGILMSRRRRTVSVAYQPMAQDAYVPPMNVPVAPVVPVGGFTQVVTAEPPAQSADGGKTQVFEKTQMMGDNDGAKTVMLQSAMAKLEFTTGERKGQQVAICRPGREMLVGREASDAEGNLHVASLHVSRRHAMLKVEGGQMTLTDLGSTSGTRVNDVPLTPNVSTPIKLNDKIEFADVAAVVIAP